MATNDAEKYRKEMRINSVPSNVQNPIDTSKGQTERPQERYSGPKISGKKISRKRKITVLKRVASLLLAAGIGVNVIGYAAKKGISYIDSLGKEPATISQLSEEGTDLSKLGLEDDTIEEIKTYDSFFENTDIDNLHNITDNEVLTIISGVEALNENVIKDKMADLEGVERANVQFDTAFDDGKYLGKINIGNRNGSEKIYTGRRISIGLFDSNSLSDDISELVLQAQGDEYSMLKDAVLNDEISKKNAIKKLKELYEEISKMATKVFTKDKRGNIEAVQYDEQKSLDGDER